MKTFSVNVKGLDKVLKNQQRLAEQKVKEIDELLNQTAHAIANEARANAPKGKGNYKALLGISNITGDIYADTSTKFKKSVGVKNDIAAYVEFGTGSNVFKGAYSFSAPEREFAKKFYVNGKGTTKSQPYLFPAFRKGIQALENAIINTLKWKRGDSRGRR